MMIEPYYKSDDVTLYCGDSREIMPTLSGFDLILADPPYGIALDTDYSKRNSTRIKGKTYDTIEGDTWQEQLDLTFLFAYSVPLVCFGANNFPQTIPFDSERDGWIVWDKRTDDLKDRILGSPFELAVVLNRRLYKMIRLLHCGFIHADGTKRIHPTEKPVKLMRRVIELFPSARCLIDPFAGTGSSLKAARNLGIKAIGIELKEQYCEMIAKWLTLPTQKQILFEE